MHQGEPDRLTRFKAEAVNIVRYFAEEDFHTVDDAKKEFKRSADTIRDRINLLGRLIADGEFRSNPEFEKEITKAYRKTVKHLSAHKRRPRIAENAAARKIIKNRLRRDLLKKSC